MTGNSSVLAAVLAVVSVLSLSLLTLLCLRCKKRSKIIQEENQIYNPQTFQREGSMFAVTRSKTVTRPYNISPTTTESRGESSPAEVFEESEYQNVPDTHSSLEHTYVAPLPISVYENEQTAEKGATGKTDDDQASSVYVNIAVLSESLASNDDDDYENSQFLDNVANEEERLSIGPPPCSETEEPDYVNENGE